jgi:putative Mg2+ transporter-C (MgtC) family protein
MSHWVVFHRLVVTALLAGWIGYERERQGRAAGLRTHILVALGSCLVMLTALDMMDTLAGRVEIDPTRLAAQVISGIGFLGAGTIMRSGTSIRGLTTAATLWVVAGIGLAVGSGFVSGAAMATVLVLTVLVGLSRWERRFSKEAPRQEQGRAPAAPDIP